MRFALLAVLSFAAGCASTPPRQAVTDLAEQKARLMEIDPSFVDVIVRRWQEYTGQQAVLSDGRDRL